MSIRVMTLVWDNFPSGGTELLAMLAMADWCSDQGGSLHPSMDAISSKLRISKCQTRRVIHGLIDAGWISVVGNDLGGPPGATRQYLLNVKKLMQTTSADAPPTASADAPPTTSADAPPTTSADAPPTTSAGARASVDATASADARDGYHGCASTASADARDGYHGREPNHQLTVSEPPVNHQLRLAPISTSAAPKSSLTTGSKKSEPDTPLQAACRETWRRYSEAYLSRYGAEPVRNAKVNASVKALVQRLGADEAPKVAAWFVSHSDAWYVRHLHDIGSLLHDAEKLRTQWATGHVMTAARAAEIDQTAANRASYDGALAILRAKGLA